MVYPKVTPIARLPLIEENTIEAGTTLRGVVAEGADGEAIDLLAERSESVAPAGAVLVAERHGELIAAIGIADGRTVINRARVNLALRARLHLERLYVRAVFALGGL